MSPRTLERLRPWQQEPAEHLDQILRLYQSGLDCSGTGTGKTYLSAAIAADSKLPTLVIGPKIARGTWERAAKHFDDSFSFVGYEMLRTGNTPFGKWSERRPSEVYFKCDICQCVVDPQHPEPCRYHPRGIHCVTTKKKPGHYGEFRFHSAVKNLIVDECHRCGGLDSLNADLLIAAKRQRIRTTALSATPASSPLGFRAIGYLLDLHNLDEDLLEPRGMLKIRVRKSFYHWAAQYGCRRDERFHGFKWLVGAERQKEVMLEIRQQIIPLRGIRITTDDIPGFPKRDIQAELYTLDDPEAVDSCYKEMSAALDALKDRAASYKNLEHPLTKILHARQQIELLKVPVFTELGESYLAQGLSVVWFVNFRATIDELAKRFPEAGIIDGQTEGRDETIAAFQDNSIRALIVNCEAGKESMSLHDLTGLAPRIGLVSPGFSAVTLQQVFGRLQRDGGLTQCYYRVIFADKTVEMKIHRAVSPKLSNIMALTDADLNPNEIQFN